MKKKLCHALPWLMVVAAYLLTITFFALYGSHNLNADDSSEMVLANLLNEEGKWLLTESWLYSTELRIISPVGLYQLGLKLFSSWHAARVFAQAVCLPLILASFLFMAHSIGMKKAAPYLATALMLPYNLLYDYIIVYGLYYAMHLILSFVLLALVFHFGQSRKRKSAALLAAIFALGFSSGLGGVRMMLMIIAPLFGAAMIITLLEMKSYETFKETLSTPSVRMGGASALCFAATGIGYVVSIVLFKEKYTYFSYTDIAMAEFRMSDFINQLSSLHSDLGYVTGVPLMSLQGIGNLIVTVLFLALFAAVFRMFIRWDKLMPAHRLLTLTTVLAVFIGMLSNIMLNQPFTRYFLVGTTLLFVVLALALEIEPCKNALLRTLMLLSMTGCCAFGAQNIMRYDYQQGKANYEVAADWLLERGYTQGYATFWNANILTEASNGQIDVWNLADSMHGLYSGKWRTMGMQPMLQETRKLTEDPQGKVFLLVSAAEQQEGSPLLDPAHYVDMVTWSYFVYEYDSVDQMRELINNAQAEQ